MSTPLIEVTFFKSRSKSFAAVASQAKCFESFIGSDGKYSLSIMSLEELFEHPTEFIYILGESVKWVGTTVRYNGVLVVDRPKMLTGKIKDIVRCYASYSGASDKRNFCNSTGNGCRRIENINLNGISGYVFRRWYKFGYFESERKYIIDKPYIKELIAQEAEDSMLELCPAFDIDLINVTVDLLPDYIDTTTGAWQVVYERVLTAEGYSTVPFSIELVDAFDGDDISFNNAPKAEKPIHEMSESEINEMLDSGRWNHLRATKDESHC